MQNKIIYLAVLAMVFSCAQAQSMQVEDKYGSVTCGSIICETACCTQLDNTVYCNNDCV